jgi:hypothetical protein
MAAAFLSREGFEHAVAALITRADSLGRGADLDRVALRLNADKTPREVSRLAALGFMLDQEFMLSLQESVDAYKRWLEKKGESATDDDVFAVMKAVYMKARQP